MAVFASDDFNRSNRTLTGDTASGGGTWLAKTSLDDMEITSNAARPTFGSSGALLDVTPPSAEYKVTGNFIVHADDGWDSGRIGIYGRASTAEDTHYNWRYDEYHPRWFLYRAVAGSYTQLDTFDEPDRTALWGTTLAVELHITDAEKSGWVDGVKRCSHPDNTITDAGLVGVYGSGGSGATAGKYPASVDDFSAETFGGGGTTPVNNDATLVWSIRQIIGATSTAQWGVLKNVSAQSTHLWSLRNLVQSEASLQWATLAQVGQTSTTIWNALQQVQADSDQRWAVRELVAGDGTLVWDLTRVVGQVATIEWDLESSTGTVGAALTARWNVLQAIAAQLQIDWDMLQSIGVDQTTMWGVLEGVAQAIDARWDVRNDVGRAVTIHWDGIGVVGEAVTMRWEVSAGGVSSPVLAIVIPAEARTIIIPDDGREIIIKADQPLH